jgi:hypothetical protein
MTSTEACAINKTVKEPAPYSVVYPSEVNPRLLRVSILYRKIYQVLLYSLFACGLEEFISDMNLNGVLFQIHFNDMENNNV